MATGFQDRQHLGRISAKQTDVVLPKGRASTDDPRPVSRNTLHRVASEIK